MNRTTEPKFHKKHTMHEMPTTGVSTPAFLKIIISYLKIDLISTHLDYIFIG